jgi:hypothetical protein
MAASPGGRSPDTSPPYVPPMARLRQLLWDAGTGAAVRNARVLLDERRREAWVVDALVRSLPSPERPAVEPVRPAAPAAAA